MHSKALNQLLLKEGSTGHTHAHTKEMNLNGLYSALQPWRIVRLGVWMAGYLAASARGWTSTPSQFSGRQKTDQGSQTQTSACDRMRPDQRRADETSIQQTREPGHASDEMRSEAATGRDQRTRSSDTRPAAADTTPSRLSLFSLIQTTTLSYQAGGPLLSGHSPPHWLDSSLDSLAVLHWTGPR